LDEEAELLLERSHARLEAARHLMAGGHWSDAISRAYYAMFFAARALLIAKGVEVRTHAGLAGKLYELYVRDGTLERADAALLPAAMAARNEADYGFPASATESQARETILDAERFLARAGEILAQSG